MTSYSCSWWTDLCEQRLCFDWWTILSSAFVRVKPLRSSDWPVLCRLRHFLQAISCLKCCRLMLNDAKLITDFWATVALHENTSCGWRSPIATCRLESVRQTSWLIKYWMKGELCSQLSSSQVETSQAWIVITGQEVQDQLWSADGAAAHKLTSWLISRGRLEADELFVPVKSLFC